MTTSCDYEHEREHEGCGGFWGKATRGRVIRLTDKTRHEPFLGSSFFVIDMVGR